MVAVFVKTKMKVGDGWKDAYSFGGRFHNIEESLGYLKYLERRDTECYIQIGFCGWNHE